MTGGLVNPLVLPALEAAGYAHSFETETFEPGAESPVATVWDWHDIELDADRRQIRLPAGSRIDLGGTAKGWAAQQTASWLSQTGPCLVDAGGDIVARGTPERMPTATSPATA